MKLEAQVCSLDLAKKLNELGVEQKSIFQWRVEYHRAAEGAVLVQGENYETKGVAEDGHLAGTYLLSAFTVAELGEMLPLYVKAKWYVSEGKRGKGTKEYKLYLAKNEYGQWIAEYQEWSLDRRESYELLPQRSADTEADARAKMLIYLKENNLY